MSIASVLRALKHKLGPRSLARLPAHANALFDFRDLDLFSRFRNEAVIRGLCTNAYLGNDTAVCRVLGRYSMFVDTQDIGFSTHMLLSGYWEMWVTEAVIRRVKPGMKVIDCGANLGYFSLLMADLIGPEGRLDAFEPNPAIAARLTKSLAVNGYLERSTVHGSALSDTTGEALLFMPDGEPKNAFMQDASFESHFASVKVPTVRLDDLPEAHDIDFIKIDVEGAEERVWNGMEGILDSSRPLTIVLEFAACRYADPAAFIDKITARGFRLELIDLAAGAIPATKETILAHSPDVDQMLILSR